MFQSGSAVTSGATPAEKRCTYEAISQGSGFHHHASVLSRLCSASKIGSDTGLAPFGSMSFKARSRQPSSAAASSDRSHINCLDTCAVLASKLILIISSGAVYGV